MTIKFNILQKNIINYQIIYPNSKAFYQKIEMNCNIDNKELYIFLLNRFPILKAIINLKEKTYTIDDKIDINKITIINNLNHNDFLFNYNKYLLAILYQNNYKIIIFHHLFVDGTSENLIYNSIINKNLKIDNNKYYNYKFDYPINRNNNETSLICDYKELNNFVENKGAILDVKLEIDENKIKNICKKLNISSHTYYVGILALVVKVYSNQDDISIFDMFSGRDERYKDTIGFFSFASEINISMGNVTLEEYFQSLYINIKKNIKIYSSSNNINIIINDVRKLSIFKKSKITQQNGNDIHNQLSLKIIDYNHILFKYNTNLLKETRINKIIKLYKCIFKKIISLDITTKLFDLELITDKDKMQVLKWGKGDYIKPINENVYELIDKNISDQIAINYNNINITYKQLKKKTDSIANFLKNKNLFQKRVIMSIDRDENIALFMLGIMKSGNIYIPILPNTPLERFNYIVNDTNANLIITNTKYKTNINIKNTGVEVFYIEDFINKEYEEIIINNPKYAYIIYTSGTSGKPKGIKFTHNNLTNGINSCLKIFPKYNSLYSTQIIWDPNFRELFLPLLNNKTVFICNNLLKDKISNDVEWINGSPNILTQLEIPKGIKLITTAGGKINKNYWNNVKHIENVWSSYGPSECCNISTLIRLEKYSTLLGTPFPNYNIYITKNNKLLPINMVGEIYIGSIGLGEKYTNNIQLTQEKFIEFNGERVYKTGDYGKWTENGELEFHGRIDNQIKMNGIRIELGEIESVIKNILEIDECVVIFKRNKLNCFTSPKTKIDIKNKLQNKLPKYMIPSFYHTLKKIPLNTNGKIDKYKLLSYLNKYNIDDITKYRIITNDISEYIKCDFALIKKTYDNFTDKVQVCLYINTSTNSTLLEIFDKLATNYNPYWIIKVNNIKINELPVPRIEDTYREIFINKYKNSINKNINLEIYDILCQTLKINQINKNISLESYGIDSLQFIQLETILSSKYNIELKNEYNYNDILLQLNRNSISYCSFHKNPNVGKVDKLLVLFKGFANNIPGLLINKKIINNKLFNLKCDFIVVTNYKFIQNGSYYDKILLDELQFYKQKYKNIYFISNSGGWKSCVHFSNIANKCLISGGGHNSQFLNKKTIKIIEENNSKLLFYYGNKKDLNNLISLQIILSIKINKYRNHFYKKKTHGIFCVSFDINNYVNYFKKFIDT